MVKEKGHSTSCFVTMSSRVIAFKKPVNLKYQVDCGPKNVAFKSLASFFETIFSALMNKQEQLIVNGQEFTVLLAELVIRAGNSTEALAVFDKLLKIAGSEN